MKDTDRRIRLTCVSPNQICLLMGLDDPVAGSCPVILNGDAWLCPDCGTSYLEPPRPRITIPGLPSGVEVVGVNYDHMRLSFVIGLRHESFDPVPNWEVPPVIATMIHFPRCFKENIR